MRKTEPFTKIPNSLITELPPILLKLYSYIKSRPEGWIFHSRGTANALDYSARLYHKSLKQLLDRGLIEKSRERRANGQLGCVTIRIKEAMFTESKQGETNNASAMFTQTKLSDTKLSDTKLSDTKHSESPQLVRLNNKKTNNKKRVRDINIGKTQYSKTDIKDSDKSLLSHTVEYFLEQTNIAKELLMKQGLDINPVVVEKFCDYWTQQCDNGKFLWEENRFFSFSKKLEEWVKTERGKYAIKY